MMKIYFFLFSLNFLSLIFNNFLMNCLIILMILFLSVMLIFLTNFLNFYWGSIYYFWGMDNLSFSLVFLNLWLLSLALYSNMKLLKNFFSLKFVQFFLILLISMTLTFTAVNILMFYIFFEVSLIPIIMIIMGWGYQVDRIQASMYMMFYTLFGSLPLILMIIFLMKNNYTLMMNILKFNDVLDNSNLFYFILMNLAFFIKMPLYFFHLWLPKAHVEAPVSGSMILAGVMLKLGSYGIYRFMIFLQNFYLNFNFLIIIMSLFGSLLASLICMNQTDMKIIVAYSSVVHMSLLMSGMMTFFSLSFKASILMMISHGLCSSGLFFLVNLSYEKIKSRNLFVNKNMINFIPSLTLWWFMLVSSNFSAPPSLNLFSEIMLFNSLIQWDNFLMILVIFVSFFSTVFSIFLYAYSQYGKYNYSQFNFNLISLNEFNLILMHWLPLNLFFIDLNLFIF